MSPPSARIEPGNQLEIKCSLPSASPPAARSWMKNNKILEPTSSLTLTEDGSLIIHSIKVTDSGNYSCVATNLAGQRISSAVPVIVRSEKRWSEWTVCSNDCVKFRTRNCGNKSPTDCVGKEVETAICTGGSCKEIANDHNNSDDFMTNANIIFGLLMCISIIGVIFAILLARMKRKKPEIPDYIVTDNGKCKCCTHYRECHHSIN